MKTKVLFLAMLIIAFSCKKSEDESTDTATITNQVKAVVNAVFSGCEEVNANKVLATCHDSPDFTYIFNGTTKNYQEFSTALAGVYDLMSGQEITLVAEKFAILDENTVLYTTNLTFLQHFKDGTDKTIDPAVMMLVFRKIDGNWKWVTGVESYS
jgi:hypothetical protein